MNEYYTYAYLREDGTPYYIGKGKGRRAFEKCGRKFPPPPKDRILFLKRNLTEEEAFKHEIYMIAVFGREDVGTGILHNFTDGGDGCSGHTHSIEARKKMSEVCKGRKFSDEHRENLRLSHLGYSPSEETRQKISEASKGRVVTEETRKKLSKANKGRVISEETRQKMSKASTGRFPSQETRKKLSEIRKGTIWITNGEKNRRIPHSDEIPEGWKQGRSNYQRKVKK